MASHSALHTLSDEEPVLPAAKPFVIPSFQVKSTLQQRYEIARGARERILEAIATRIGIHRHNLTPWEHYDPIVIDYEADDIAATEWANRYARTKP